MGSRWAHHSTREPDITGPSQKQHYVFKGENTPLKNNFPRGGRGALGGDSAGALRSPPASAEGSLRGQRVTVFVRNAMLRWTQSGVRMLAQKFPRKTTLSRLSDQKSLGYFSRESPREQEDPGHPTLAPPGEGWPRQGKIFLKWGVFPVENARSRTGSAPATATPLSARARRGHTLRLMIPGGGQRKKRGGKRAWFRSRSLTGFTSQGASRRRTGEHTSGN